MSSSRVALVTGVSSGIGRSIALALAARGYRVFGTVRDLERAGAAPGVELVELDVTRPDSIRACVAAVLQRAGRVEVLVKTPPAARAGVGLRAQRAHSIRGEPSPG